MYRRSRFVRKGTGRKCSLNLCRIYFPHGKQREKRGENERQKSQGREKQKPTGGLATEAGRGIISSMPTPEALAFRTRGQKQINNETGEKGARVKQEKASGEERNRPFYLRGVTCPLPKAAN
jgi:hypothetical protein